MEIRDARDKEWTWMDNEYLNGYAKHLGPICSVVYFSLCRYSDNTTQKCFPSMEKIAQENGVSEKSVSRAIKTLSDWGIILVEEKYDKKNKRRKNNVYTLLKKNGWKQKPPDSQSSGNDVKEVEPPDSQSKSHQTDVPSNYTYINYTNTSEQGSHGNEVNQIIELFKSVNPTYEEFFKNKTERSAVEYLLTKFGYEKVSRTVEALSDIIKKKYAPKITKPTELKRDLGKLLAFYSQEKDKSKKLKIII